MYDESYIEKLTPEKINELVGSFDEDALRRHAAAYFYARQNKLEAQAELAETRSKSAELESDRDRWKGFAERWHDWLQYMHPEHFDDNGKWLDKPRKTKFLPKPHKAQDNSIVPGIDKNDDNVAPVPTNTQVMAPVKVAKAPRKKSMTWVKSRVKTFMSDLDN